MAAAHAAAEAARAGAHASTGTIGSAGGYTYVVQKDGSKKLNSVDSTLLTTINKSGYSSMNGSSYIPQQEIKSTQTVKPSTSTPAPSISMIAGTPYTQLAEDSKKLNLVNGYFEAQKNPQAAQQGAKDAINQNLTAWSFAGGEAIGAVGNAVLKKVLTKSGEKVLEGTGKIISPSNAAKQIVNADRTGTALIKSDPAHRAASYLSEKQLAAGKTFNITGGDGVQRTLLQTPGSLNGKSGIYEYMLEPNGTVSHQRFIENGIITGKPNQVVKP